MGQSELKTMHWARSIFVRNEDNQFIISHPVFYCPLKRLILGLKSEIIRGSFQVFQGRFLISNGAGPD